MSRFLSTMTKQIIGPGHALADANPVPILFRQTPIVVEGALPTAPAGANPPTGSSVSTIPKPQ